MPSLTYSAGLFIFQTCKPPENDCCCLPHPLCGEMPQAVAGDRGPPLLPTGHPSVNHWTVHLATEAPTPSPGPPSLLVPQHPQNMHQNTTFASRDELIPGSPVPASELPAPATPTTLLAAGYGSGEAGHERACPRAQVPLGLASPLSHGRFQGQIGCTGDAIWLPADASPPVPSLRCPGLLQEMEPPAPVGSLNQEGASLYALVQRELCMPG